MGSTDVRGCRKETRKRGLLQRTHQSLRERPENKWQAQSLPIHSLPT
jgi:hypothetical protein